MKKIAFAIVALFAMGSCTSPEDIIDDFQIHVTPTFYKYVVEMDVFDLNDPNTEFTGNLNITVSGKDSEGVYNIDGTKNFKLYYGTLQLMIRNGMEPTANNPLRFTVHFEGSGYVSQSVPIRIQEEEYYLEKNVPLLNLNNLPNTVAVKEKTQAVDPSTGRLTAPLVISTGSPDSTSRVQLTIPETINFLDKDGNVIMPTAGQSLKASIIALSDTSQTAQQAMPNGGGMVQPMKVDGQIEQVIFDPSATFNINMTIGNTQVTQFSDSSASGGIKARIPLPAGMYNMEKDRAYQAGDSISLASFSEGDSAWKAEDDIYLVKLDQASGDLFAEPIIKHLSWWRFRYCYHYWFWSRPTPKRYIFTGHLHQANGEGVNATVGIRTSEGWYSTTYFTYGNFSNKGVFKNPYYAMTSYSRNTKSLSPGSRVYYGPAGVNLAQVEQYSFAGYTVFDARLESTSQPPTIGYKLYCSSSNSVVTPPPGAKIYYKKNGTNDPFRHLHTVTQNNQLVSQQKMYELEDGVRYDFMARFNEFEVDTANVLVEDGKIYQLTIPQSACSALGL